MKRRNTDAVSPVVGVMLMLVVTIIIAAVVSAFAGGLASDTSKAPQASLSVVAVIKDIQDTNKTNWDPNYPDDFTAKNGLLFEHMGGDAFALSDISIQLQSRDAKYTISTYDKIPTTNCLPNDVESYIMEIGDSDGFITRATSSCSMQIIAALMITLVSTMQPRSPGNPKALLAGWDFT